ncbi:MAG: hypothetical protein R3B60_00855 [Candidatus Paceibacterota bacterium]
MINLLPPEAKKNVVTEYWIRVTSVWIFILSVVLISVSLLLLPVYVLIDSQIGVYENKVNEMATKVADFDNAQQSLVKANNQAQVLINLRSIKKFSDLVDSFNSLQNNGLSISSMQFNRSDLKLNSVQLMGEAKTRQDLSDFRNNLLSLSKVSQVDLPISNLAKDRDIDFSIAVTLNDQEN